MKSDIIKDVAYKISSNLTNVQKFKFYKSALLFEKTMRGDVDLLHKTRKYLSQSIEAIADKNARIALLHMERDLIMTEYLALKSI